MDMNLTLLVLTSLKKYVFETATAVSCSLPETAILLANLLFFGEATF